MSRSVPYVTDVAIATSGSVNAGKSSLVGVLTSGQLDNGSGRARNTVAVHAHEVATGNTSAISTRSCVLSDLTTDGDPNRAMTFVDLCGHEKYFKTTSFGISGYFPDYAFLLVGATKGVVEMTSQHLRLLVSFNIPVVIIVTRIDDCPEDSYEMTCEAISEMCQEIVGKATKALFLNGMTEYNEFLLTGMTPAVQEKMNIAEGKIYQILTRDKVRQLNFPVVTISNVNGFYLDVIKRIVARLPQRNFWSSVSEKGTTNNVFVKYFMSKIDRTLLPENYSFDGSLFYIDSVYKKEVGLIAAGILRGNTLNQHSELFIGPFGKEFHAVRIKSFHNNVKQDIATLENHHRGCIAFVPVTAKTAITREQISKGMIMISGNFVNNLCYHFRAVITIYANSLTLKNGYSPVINMSTIRQTARLILDKPLVHEQNGEKVENILVAGDVAVVTFKFKIKPEFIEPYNIFIFRSGNIHGVGMVVRPIPLSEDTDAKPDPMRVKNFRRSIKKHK
jgi:elongation factor 1-alpha